MPLPVLCTPLDDASATLAVDYAPGGGSVTLAEGAGAMFGAPSADNPIRVRLFRPAAFDQLGRLVDPAAAATFRVTGRTGDQLTGLSLESGTDQDYPAGSFAACVVGAADLADVHAWLAAGGTGGGSYVTTDTAQTVTGVKTFSMPIFGSVTGTAANVTGTVAIGHGGTGATTAAGALNALLPSQSGNGGKVLTTDGSAASWADATGGGGGGVPGGTAGRVPFETTGGALTDAPGLNFNASTNTLTLGEDYPKSSQLIIKTNTPFGYGSGGIKLIDNAGGNVVVLQPFAGNSLYITDGAGGSTPLTLGQLNNPADGSMLALTYGALTYRNPGVPTIARFVVGDFTPYGVITSTVAEATQAGFASYQYDSQTAPAYAIFATSSTTRGRAVGGLYGAWSAPTDAARAGDVWLSSDGYNGPHEGIRFRDAGTFSQPIIPLANLRDAADDAAAAALSPAVPVGGLYRTGSILKVRVS